VNWFNAVDDTYRADLRELNELNFGRFDAKLEQRLAELDAKWGGRWTQLDAKLEQRLAELRAELVRELADVKSGLKWMLVFWDVLLHWIPTFTAALILAIAALALDWKTGERAGSRERET
jgi:hypothetical protein